MQTFDVTFWGRKAGAIGIRSQFRERIEVEKTEDILPALYEKYEHISSVEIVNNCEVLKDE